MISANGWNCKNGQICGYTIRTFSFHRKKWKRNWHNFPERFSPNVILRGLFQETILPNIAFVGGGGETAYWLELKPLFKHYRVPFPVLILRNSFLLIKKNWRKKWKKPGFQSVDIFKPEEKLDGRHLFAEILHVN